MYGSQTMLNLNPTMQEQLMVFSKRYGLFLLFLNSNLKMKSHFEIIECTKHLNDDSGLKLHDVAFT